MPWLMPVFILIIMVFVVMFVMMVTVMVAMLVGIAIACHGRRAVCVGTFNDFFKFAPVEPNASATGAMVNFHPLGIGNY